jgi:protein-S-isoprenylcysteine O-methyltransferase Ste14
VPIFLLVVDRWFIRREETLLRRKFGQEFEDYRARTRRWL